jgi:hypothetical protein
MNFAAAPKARPGYRLAGFAAAAVLAAACSAAPPSDLASIATSSPTDAPLPTLTPTTYSSVPGLYVDASVDAGEVSPYVYGTNYGPWLFVPLQMQPAAEAAHLTVMRYPGGNWGDLNDMDEWNLDQYIALSRQFGAEPYVHVRLKNGSAAKAASWVQYLNIDKGYGVKFWSIGNEPNLFDDYDTAMFNQQWREWAVAMKAIDPSIVLIGPEINQFIPNGDEPYETELERWMVEFLDANGDMVDIVSFHRYPFPRGVNGGPPSIDELRATSAEFDISIPYLRALIREHTGRDLPVAITEANSSWAASSGGDTTLDSHFNAIWWGDSLGRMIRQGAYMVNQFAIIGDFGLMGNYEVKPIYNVYLMYKNFGVQRVAATPDDGMVSVFAAKRDDGALTVMVVNLASEASQIPLTVAGQDGAITEAYLFDKEHAAVQVDVPAWTSGTTLNLTPESMLLLVFAD